MALFRIQIELKSPLATPLKGDTIWGHAAWGIANHEGEQAVADFIKDCKENAAFIPSSAFPAGFVCKQIPEVTERVENLSPEDYARIKRGKKIKYEGTARYFDGACETHARDGKNPFEKAVVTHNTISRLSNSVLDGGLYSAEEMWARKENSLFDIYILSSYTAARVKNLCEWAFENGFGADSSVGKGRIEIHGNPTEVRAKLTGKKYMALSPFVVSDMNLIQNLRADVFVRSGKIGGSFVSSHAPYKKTVVLYEEGAVFESEKHLEYIGEILGDVHSDQRIAQCAAAPVIPIE